MAWQNFRECSGRIQEAREEAVAVSETRKVRTWTEDVRAEGRKKLMWRWLYRARPPPRSGRPGLEVGGTRRGEGLAGWEGGKASSTGHQQPRGSPEAGSPARCEL